MREAGAIIGALDSDGENPAGAEDREESKMSELITTLVRKKSGLYDLRITTPDGKPILDVTNVRYKRAVELIAETEEKREA